jgi:hypothetical protein
MVIGRTLRRAACPTCLPVKVFRLPVGDRRLCTVQVSLGFPCAPCSDNAARVKSRAAYADVCPLPAGLFGMIVGRRTASMDKSRHSPLRSLDLGNFGTRFGAEITKIVEGPMWTAGQAGTDHRTASANRSTSSTDGTVGKNMSSVTPMSANARTASLAACGERRAPSMTRSAHWPR